MPHALSHALPFIALWLAGLALWCQPNGALAQVRPVARWRRWQPAWAQAWLLAVALAWLGGVLEARGACAVFGCIGLAAWWQRSARHHSGIRLSLGPWVIGALALALALHAVPGIHNPLVLDHIQWRPGDPVFSLSASFDKACAGLLLLATLVPRCNSLTAARALLPPSILAALLTTVAAMGFGWAWGLTEPALTWPQVPGRPEAVPLFLALNLFVTCLAEEAFFRGLLQSALMNRWGTRGAAGLTAIALPAALFGLAHLGGGPKMAVLATVVGLGSGWAFARTRCIEAAVLVHFAVNAVHLLAFTYPARAG